MAWLATVHGELNDRVTALSAGFPQAKKVEYSSLSGLFRMVIMGYGTLSELLVLIHFLFAAFVAVGGLLVWWSRKFAWVHLPALVWGMYMELSGAICPLTPIEIAWRSLGRAEGYEPGMIEALVLPVLYPEDLTRPIQLALGAALAALNALVYWRAFLPRKSLGAG